MSKWHGTLVITMVTTPRSKKQQRRLKLAFSSSRLNTYLVGVV